MNDLENHMVIPYADDETSERFLPDEDDAHEIERQIEIDEAARKSPAARHADELSATLLDIAFERTMRRLNQAK